MFGKLHLLLATACTLALIVPGYSKCPVVQWGVANSNMVVFGPLVISGDKREVDVQIPFLKQLGCDVVGVSAFTCESGLDTKMYFVDEFTVHVSRQHAFSSTLYGIVYCTPVIPHQPPAHVPNNLRLRSVARPLLAHY